MQKERREKVKERESCRRKASTPVWVFLKTNPLSLLCCTVEFLNTDKLVIRVKLATELC